MSKANNSDSKIFISTLVILIGLFIVAIAIPNPNPPAVMSVTDEQNDVVNSMHLNNYTTQSPKFPCSYIDIWDCAINPDNNKMLILDVTNLNGISGKEVEYIIEIGTQTINIHHSTSNVWSGSVTENAVVTDSSPTITITEPSAIKFESTITLITTVEPHIRSYRASEGQGYLIDFYPNAFYLVTVPETAPASGIDGFPLPILMLVFALGIGLIHKKLKVKL